MFIKYSICIVQSHVISFPDSFHDLIVILITDCNIHVKRIPCDSH